MATTTNYSWTTPDDTDLVKDGAAAIRTLGTAIDTTVFNNAGAAIAKTIVDAKGDIIAATAADTVARLAVGANDTVLTADSSTASGLKWAAPAAGGMTEIATGNLTSTEVVISSIPTTYKNLQLVVRDFQTSPGLYFALRVNGITSSSYGYTGINHTAVNTFSLMGEGAVTYILTDGTSLGGGDVNALLVFNLEDYANTTTNKIVNFTGIAKGSSGTYNEMMSGVGQCQTTSAITSITMFAPGETWTGGNYILYGVK